MSVFTKTYNFLIKISDTNSELVVKLIPTKYETNSLPAFGQEDFHKILYKRRYHAFFTTGKAKKKI